MPTKSERLTICRRPNSSPCTACRTFDDGQRLDYLSLSESELGLASSRPSLCAKAYCALQIGYFKAKHTFKGEPQLIDLT